MFTVGFLSHHSKHLILENVEKIINYNLGVSIIVVENSLDISLKNILEKKYEGLVKVYLPKENLGWGGGLNKILELSEDNFVFLNPADVNLSFDCIKNLIDCVKNFNDFTLLSPTYSDESIFKNYDENKFSLDNKEKNHFQILDKFNLKEVDFIDAHWVVNKSKINNYKIMDENFFLYFETMDMCLKFKKEGKKMFIIDNIKFEHYGGASHEKKYDLEASLSRNWHYNWSKFYYFKKNFSYLYALKKFIPILFKLLLKYIFKLFNSKKNQEKYLVKAEINGALSSIFLKKPTYRPFKKK